MNITNNRTSLLIIFALVGLLIWAALDFPSCKQVASPVARIQTDSLKAEVRKDKAILSDIKQNITAKDTADKKATRKWNTIKKLRPGSAHKCDTVIKEIVITCDSTLAAKDSAIAARDSALSVSQRIIANQWKIMESDSINIRFLTAENIKLTKKVKRLRFWNKVLAVVGIGSAGAVLMSK